jgi:hypothetical protein
MLRVVGRKVMLNVADSAPEGALEQACGAIDRMRQAAGDAADATAIIKPALPASSPSSHPESITPQ